MFTVKQYSDKHFKLNGLGNAQGIIWTETVVGIFGGILGEEVGCSDAFK